jgi:hypothetical protein
MSSSRPSAFLFSQQGPYRLYSTTELLKLPPPAWLVDKVIPKGGFVTLYAPPEHYKSFLALDIALAVATGRSWQGHAILEPGGFVVYIAAEGVNGLGKRALAWLGHHGVDPETPDIAWLTESLAITADSDALLDLLVRIEQEVRRVPVLVVIDTLARCFPGKESTELGAFVAGVDVLRHKFKCAVLVVHHTRLDASRERGGTELRAASDAMLAVAREDQQITVSCEKMKDAEHFEDIQLQLRTVEGTESCVLVGAVGSGALEDSIVSLLHQYGPLSWNDWRDLCLANGYAAFVSVSARKSVRARIEKVGGLWRVRA